MSDYPENPERYDANVAASLSRLEDELVNEWTRHAEEVLRWDDAHVAKHPEEHLQMIYRLTTYGRGICCFSMRSGNLQHRLKQKAAHWEKLAADAGYRE